MYTVIIFLGFYNLLFALFHLLFWRLFKQYYFYYLCFIKISIY
ncbi:hypothetical protein HMPREF9072_01495 [Capnocytophaga sp. oral taxon 324 str. F0483]|nr:hypothetical protein HMPREF9072_01495 [Capnocytophaga sp. oral taxon 324 str. F0483]